MNKVIRRHLQIDKIHTHTHTHTHTKNKKTKKKKKKKKKKHQRYRQPSLYNLTQFIPTRQFVCHETRLKGNN